MAPGKRPRPQGPKAKRSKPASDTVTAPKKHTIYLQNSNAKIPTEDLRTALYLLCSVYGRVLAVNTHKSPKMRGQAHIAFESPQSAALALKSLKSSDFFGKPIAADWARSESQRAEWKSNRA